jgi:hypothetical protein
MCYAMAWPAFLASTILQRSTYWARYWISSGLIHVPRRLTPPLQPRQLYFDEIPHFTAAVTVGPPRLAMVYRYSDARPIAFAEMAAALQGLLWFFEQLDQQTTVTLYGR